MEPSNFQPAATEETGMGYGDIAQRIANWTSNLLATAVVIVIAIVGGTHLVSAWMPVDSSSNEAEFMLADAWPTLETCSLEFGAVPFRLVRQTVTGDQETVFENLQARCARALELDPSPVSPAGPEEEKMIASAADWIPVQQQAGKWRIFRSQPSDAADADTVNALSSQLPIVLGIRDDCASESGLSSRLVVWCIALAGEHDQWTTFLGQASPTDGPSRIGQAWIPDFARRTLSISDHQGGSLTGFSGGQKEQAVEFFNTLAEKNCWLVLVPWQQSNDVLTARFKPNGNSSIAGIQVQLHAKHNGIARGILMVQAKNNMKEVDE